jgi:hypothetical protein
VFEDRRLEEFRGALELARGLLEQPGLTREEEGDPGRDLIALDRLANLGLEHLLDLQQHAAR